MNISSLNQKSSLAARKEIQEPVVVPWQGIESPPLDGAQFSSEALSGVKPATGLGPLTSGLLDNFGGDSAKADKKLQRDLKNFEDRLPPSALETFQKLEPSKKKDVMELGKSFAGTNIANSPLLRLMEDGRLFEKDGSGATPLQRLTEIGGSGPNKGKGKDNFLMRVLTAIENPGQSRDAQKRGVGDATNSPSEFIRQAGEEYMSAETLNTPTEWDDSPLQP